MLRYVVVYDIENDKSRKEVSDILEAYGIRVQRSVFEIECKNKKELERLKKELLKNIDKRNDSIRFYFMCENCIKKAFDLDERFKPFDKDSIYFF